MEDPTGRTRVSVREREQASVPPRKEPQTRRGRREGFLAACEEADA
jgi:hypothetical protein